VPLVEVGALVREDGQDLAIVESLDGGRGDDDPATAAGHAVREGTSCSRTCAPYWESR